MERLGGPGAGLLIAAENLFPPLPSEIILPLAGFTASQGSFTLAGAIGWTTAGSVVGALLLYTLGAVFGRARFHAVWSRLPLVNMEDLHRTEAWFERHGRKAIFFGRMIPIFRSLISIPAGVERMPLPVFTGLTLAGSLIWNTVFVVAGYQLGENWHVVEEYAGVFQKIVLVVVAVAVSWWVVNRVRTLRQGRAPTPGP
ncbi:MULTISPECIES: DedA family protein [unclassified Ornithinimicrobium]|uniref:DedA family protein n=1 Tax=unclassified Ornithinimicrobium TaxID=2615080 RepID=UPI0038547E97